MTAVQMEIYSYCRAIGLSESAALKTAVMLRTRADLEKIRGRARLLLWALGAALLLTAAAVTLA